MNRWILAHFYRMLLNHRFSRACGFSINFINCNSFIVISIHFFLFLSIFKIHPDRKISLTKWHVWVYLNCRRPHLIPWLLKCRMSVDNNKRDPRSRWIHIPHSKLPIYFIYQHILFAFYYSNCSSWSPDCKSHPPSTFQIR